jgi:DNA-binding response OmpR family regulator
MSDDALQGFRILIVEDNSLLAMTVDSILRSAGADVVGPVGLLEEAERLAASEPITAALLDIKLNDDEVWPVARILAVRRIPFVFCSGHFDRGSLPVEWGGCPILTKPARARQMIDALAGAIRGAG